MTSERDIDHVLARWMDDGPTVVADRVIATAMTDVQTTPQLEARRTRLKELFMTMKPVMTMLGVAAAALIALAAFQMLTGGGVGTTRLISADELPSIVLNSTNAPDGWSIDGELEGEDALAHPIRSDPRSGTLESVAAGFVDSRAVDFCTSGEGCGTSWVAAYENEEAAHAAFEVLATEFLVGWVLSPQTINVPNELGEERRAFHDGMQGPTAPELIVLWRVDNLLLGVAGVGGLEGDRLVAVADQMDARVK